MENIIRVGMREFRAHLQEYLMTSSPVAITKHGETIGFYIPAHQHPHRADLEVLKQAASNLEKLLSEAGVTEGDLFEDFRKLRKHKKGAARR